MGRFDLSFKSLADSSPLTLLRLFAPARVDEGTRFERLDRELAMNLKSIDHAFRLFRGGAGWVEHFEAEMVISADDLMNILLRGVTLRIKYSATVWTTIILLSRRHAAAIPEVVTDQAGSYTTVMRAAVVRLWEIPADRLVENDALEALPVVGAMKATPEEINHVVRRLSRIEDREMRSRLSAEMVTWSSLNYNKNEVLDIRARLGMVTTKEVLMASPIGEEILEYGMQEGLRKGQIEGLQRGRLSEARRSLQVLADARFPGLLDPNLVQTLTDIAVIEAVFLSVALAPDAAQARGDVQRILG